MTNKPTLFRLGPSLKPGTLSLPVVLNLSIGGIFAITAIVAVLYVRSVMRQHALDEAEAKARIILDHNLATHTYFSHDLKPAVFELSGQVSPPDYFDPTWMSSTYAVRAIDGYYRQLNDERYYYKEAAINARSPQNEADALERSFLEKLNTDPTLVDRSLVRTIDGEPYFVTLRRGEVLAEACLRCHSEPENAPGEMVELYGDERSFQRSVDEVISAISIRVPLSDAYASADHVTWRLSGMLLVALLGLFFVQWLVYTRLVFQPLEQLRDKTHEIATGHAAIGERIALSGGKPFAELADAFNAMSLTLRQEQESLEGRIQQRTHELARANSELQADIAAREQAEQALREKTEELDHFFSSALDLLCIATIDGRFLRLNVMWEQMLGYQLEELEGRQYLDFVHPDDRESTLATADKLAAGDVVVNFVNRYRRQDGSYRWLEWRSAPHGGLLYAAARDITERKQMEEALRESEARYRAIAMNFPNGIVALYDHDLRYIVADGQGLAQSGLSTEMLEGERLRDVFPPDIYERDEPALRAALRGEASDVVVPYGDRIYRVHTLPLRDSSGNVISGMVMTQDVTEQKQLEEALRQSEFRYRTMSELSSDYAYSIHVEDDGRKVREWVSDGFVRITGFSPAELSEHEGWRKLVHPDDVELVEERVARLYGGQEVDTDYRIITKTGETRWLRDYVKPVWDEREQRVIRVYGAAQDITERKEADAHKAQLALEQEKAQILQRFVVDLSHEFRTPLSVIHTGLDLLERTVTQAPAAINERIKRLKQATMYISTLVDAMLTMAKMDSISRLPMTATDVNSVATNVYEALQTGPAKPDVGLAVELVKPSPVVMGSFNDLKRALIELVENAFQFTPPDGHITLRTQVENEYAVFEVSDTGIGISDHDLPLIFERFYRADTARTERHAGLGLAITQRIIDLHGGRVEVTSEAGIGSTFKVLLPLANE